MKKVILQILKRFIKLKKKNLKVKFININTQIYDSQFLQQKNVRLYLI